MIKYIRYINLHLCLIFILLFSNLGLEATYQETILVGPILAGVIYGIPRGIVFQDIGTNNVWNWAIPEGSFVSIHGWSSNGCKLLIRLDQKWATLSIIDLTYTELPILAFSDHVFWSPDGETVTLTIENERGASVFLLNTRNHSKRSLFEGLGKAIQWLSDTKLLYQKGADLYVWDVTTQQTQFFDTVKLLYWTPSIVHSTAISPNWQMGAAYYDVNNYEVIYYETNNDGPAAKRRRAAADEVPRVPGFDIYFFEEGIQKHVDIPAFLESLEWSSSSQKIAVTAHNQEPVRGIYVYDVVDDVWEKVDDFIPASLFFPYEPTWSPDGKWLTIQTEENGAVVYRLSDGELVELDEQMVSSRLWWSPVMDYGNTQCAIQENPTPTSTPTGSNPY